MAETQLGRPHSAAAPMQPQQAAVSGPATCSSLTSTVAQAQKQQQRCHKLEIYIEELRRLHDVGTPKVRVPGFDDWILFSAYH